MRSLKKLKSVNSWIYDNVTNVLGASVVIFIQSLDMRISIQWTLTVLGIAALFVYNVVRIYEKFLDLSERLEERRRKRKEREK